MSKKGFTLVELLVVISIIAVLSIIGLTIFGDIQVRSRDARRKADIAAISKALEVHYNDTACGASATTPYCAVTDGTHAAVLFATGIIPVNPSPGGAAYTVPGAAAATYTVCANLEKSTGNYSDAGTTAVAAGTGTYYCIKNQQ